MPSHSSDARPAPDDLIVLSFIQSVASIRYALCIKTLRVHVETVGRNLKLADESCCTGLRGADHRERRVCLDLGRSGFRSTVRFWNGDSETVDDIVRACLQLLNLLRNLDSHSYLSVKLPAMRFDPEAVSVVLQAGARAERLVHFDSHAPEDADRMFVSLEEGLRSNRNLGCTIPGRWGRSTKDARTVAGWGLRVRVVKGQWADPEEPDMDMRAGFMRVIDELAGRANCVAVASHDLPLAQQALRRLLCCGTRCELELLYGLPWRAAVKMARALGVPVRFYVPQGKAWLPYLLKQVRKNPRVLGWFVRDLVRGCTSETRP